VTLVEASISNAIRSERKYVAAGFHAISDGAVGSVIGYGSATSVLHDIAGKPG
jgi:hypothetical protein